MNKNEIIAEYIRCSNDIDYFAYNYCKVYDQTQGGFVSAKVFPRQKELLKHLQTNRFSIVLKPRQAGVSTMTALYCAHKILFSRSSSPTKVLIVANKRDTAIELLKKIKGYIESAPSWLGVTFKDGSNNKSEFFCTNESGAKAVGTSPDALRGYTPNVLVLDETAFIEGADELWTASAASLSTGGRAIFISTPNGQDPLYYKTYDESIKGKNDFKIFDMYWWQDPRFNKDLSFEKERIIDVEKEDGTIRREVATDVKYAILNPEGDDYRWNIESIQTLIKKGYEPTSQWFRTMCATYNWDERKIAQELKTVFTGSGDNVVKDEYIKRQELNIETPINTGFFDNNLHIWEEPIEENEYVLGCLPPDEKVLTQEGLKNVQDVTIDDKLINENGDYVSIINRQIYPVTDEKTFTLKLDNVSRRTTFTKEHPILVSKPKLKRNNKVNDINWDFNFKYTRAEELEVGDWIKVPNIYNKKIELDNTYEKLPLKDEDFWWLVGLFLNQGKIINNEIILSFVNNNNFDKVISILKDYNFLYNLNEDELFINDDELLKFIEDYFYNNSLIYINEKIKFINDKYKKQLLKGFFSSNGSAIFFNKKSTVKIKLLFMSDNLLLLESIQDLFFSIGIITDLKYNNNSRLNEYILTLNNDDSIEFIKNYNENELDSKFHNITLEDLKYNDKKIMSYCHFSTDKKFIYFRISEITESIFSGNVYNFECDTHTFMCRNITTHNCDVSRGDAEDYSSIIIWNMTTGEQACEWVGKVPPDVLGEMINEIGLKYNAYVVVDITGGLGTSTIIKLNDLNYPNLHYSDSSNATDTLKNKFKLKDNSEKIPGFLFGKNRTQIISCIEQAIRNNEIKIKSKRLLVEFATFVYINGRADHLRGYHDDLIMALGMILYSYQYSFVEVKKYKNQTKKMLEAIKVRTTKTEEENIPYNQRLHNPNDYSWLF